MRTFISISTDSYTQTIDTFDYEYTAQEYIDDCIMYNGPEYFAADIGADIIATVYADNADPLFDEPINTTRATIYVKGGE